VTFDLSRRDFVRLGVGAGLAVAGGSWLSACSTGSSSTAKAAESTVRVGYLPITDSTPLILAHAKGLYEEQGLEAPQPTLFRSWAGIAEAFAARQIDVAHLLMPLTVQMRFDQNVPLKVVAWNHTDGSGLTVGPQISNLADLAGTTVAIPFWHSIHNVVLQMLLREEGLTPIISGNPSPSAKTVKLVVMGPPDMPPALANGDIAGFIVADPFNSFAELEGIGRILRYTGDVWREHACCVVVMHEDRVAEDPEWAQSTINAIAAAQVAARQDRGASAQLLSREGEGYLPQPAAVVERALAHFDSPGHSPTEALHHPAWGNERIDFSPYPYPTFTERLVTEMKGTLVSGNRGFLVALDPASVHEELVDDRFITQVLKDSSQAASLGIESFTRQEEINV